MLVFLGGCAFTRHSAPVAIASVGASAFVGFGTGRAIEGDWSTSGRKFAVADSAFIAGYAYGLRGVGCFDEVRRPHCDELAYTTLWLGVLGLIGSHVWQAVR